MDLSAGIIPFTSVTASGPVDLASAIPTDNLSSRTVLITGGSSGLGAAMALSLASHGANIIIGDLASQAKRAAELVAKLRKASGHENQHFIAADVLSWSSQVALFQTAASLSPHGGIDCVIANAGIADGVEAMRFANPPAPSSLADSSTAPPPALKTVEVNLIGVLYTTHLALSYLSANPDSTPCSPSSTSTTTPRDRHLLLVSSIAGLAPLPTQPLYAASKHGVVGLFRSLRLTVAQTHGIRVNMLCPYFVDTPILGPGGALVCAGGEMAHIEDVAEAATRLVADNRIVGRGLEIGARGKSDNEQNRAAGLEPAAAAETGEDDGGQQKGGQAVWDVYAHDFEQSDIFTRRVIAVTNLVATARGWRGIVFDIAARLVNPLRRLIWR